MSPRPFIVGNWKMHRTPAEAAGYLRKIVPGLTALAGGRDIAVAPPFLAFHSAREILNGSGVALAAQDAHWEEEGPFTGEISAKMLKETGCRFVIVGHSERRESFGDTDRRVNRKARAVIFWGMTPIICVGEKADEREQTLVMAYEPIWAIGTGRNATPGEAAEMHRRIRAELALTFGQDRASGMRILYGGSVTPSNARTLLATEGIDGALVGGASLDGESFNEICRATAARAGS
jgi:triosephosphate isomerase